MNNFIKKILFLIFLIILTLPVKAADNLRDGTKMQVTIPPVIKLEGIGLSPQNQNFGIPNDNEGTFSLVVAGSQTNDFWELTTNQPIGVSISYNTKGSIIAVFVSMVRAEDGFELPNNFISIYPSKVVFGTDPVGGGGSLERIFHFSPLIRVSKDTPPGKYIATITFTVLGE